MSVHGKPDDRSPSEFLGLRPKDPRDPWTDTPQPPGSKEAAVIAVQMKRDQQRKKPKKKGNW